MNRNLKAISASLLVTLFASITPQSAGAESIEILKVDVRKSGDEYHFSVTLKHPDTGWDHYANEWKVSGKDGTVFGTRVLAHPHVDEQPFTRSLRGVEIPQGIAEVMVTAGDNLGHQSEKPFIVKLPQ